MPTSPEPGRAPRPALRLLFVCHGDTSRGPMAAVLARRRLRDLDVGIETAGISAHERTAADLAVAAMRERGLDLTRHAPRRVAGIDLDRFDVVVVLDREALPLVRRLRGGAAQQLLLRDVPAPRSAGTLDGYRACADALDAIVRDLRPALVAARRPAWVSPPVGPGVRPGA